VRSNLRSWLAATAFPAVPRGGSLYRHSGLDVSLSREEEGKQSPPVVEKATLWSLVSMVHEQSRYLKVRIARGTCVGEWNVTVSERLV